MDELIRRKSVEHNDLITSVAKMDKIPLKMFSLAVSCIDTENPPKDNTVYLSKKELFAFFDVKDKDKHTRFKKMVEKMQKQAYFQIQEKKGKGYEVESIVPVPYVKWNDYDDHVTIEFNSHIMPYLVDLQKSFTQINVLDLINLQSKYSVVLYKILRMNYNQFEKYAFSGERTKKQLDDLKNPTISVSELRRISNTEENYSRFEHFESRVIRKPIEEINKYTELNVTYEKIKSGRSIKNIKFFIEKEGASKNEFYKEEQQDPVYLQSEEDKMRLFFEAAQSPYTHMLLARDLIQAGDTTDVDKMVNLMRLVYPLYDKLKAMGGVEAVEKHLMHIKIHMQGTSKGNIAKYLWTCAENFVNGEARNIYE